jgi:septal ring factor EnvC (AmiA/AmiB activator)
MSTKQELIDFQSAELVELDGLIAQKEEKKLSIDNDIAGAEINIASFEAQIVDFGTQKDQCDLDIADYNAYKGKINEIIAIIEAS